MPPKRKRSSTAARQSPKKPKTKVPGPGTKRKPVQSGSAGTSKLPPAPPRLFTVPRTQPKGKRKPGQLTAKQLQQYYKDGFLIVSSFFKDSELDPVLDDMEKEIDNIVERLYKAGKIKNKHKDADVFHRLTLIVNEFPGAHILLHKLTACPVALQTLMSNERLLNIMEQLVGPEVAGNPNWNVRPKIPLNEEATAPWHQDNAYFDDDAQNVFLPTTWIPMLDVNVNNGCMQFLRGGHRTGVVAEHTACAGNSFFIETSEEEMVKSLGVDMKKDLVTCEIKKGDFILFNNLAPHRSLENYSDKIRWAFDLRFQSAEIKSSASWGVKDHILLRSKNNPKHEIQWDEFNKVNRIKTTNTANDGAASQDDDEFDTTISGPWLHRWEIVNHNRHTVNWQ